MVLFNPIHESLIPAFQLRVPPPEFVTVIEKLFPVLPKSREVGLTDNSGSGTGTFIDTETL